MRIEDGEYHIIMCIYIYMTMYHLHYHRKSMEKKNIYIYNTIYDYISPYGRTILAKMCFDQCKLHRNGNSKGKHEASIQ